jgi:hypothetical protein
VVVSHGCLWMFFAREKISFKKKPARHRAKPCRRGAPARPVEEIPGPA